ncbi:MAG: porin family protein [Bacteroidota bacterium]
MKKILCSAILTAITACVLQAQVAIKPSVGFNLTDFSKDPATGKFKSKVGYQVGGSIAFGKKVYIEPGLYYVRKSTEFIDENDNPHNVNYNISGIRIPVSIGASFIGNEKSIFALRGFAGASAFILTRIEDLDKDDFKSASWGAFAGIGVDISFLFVEAKYEWSLTNLKKEDLTQIDVGKSRSIFVNAGVRIPL